MQKFKKITACLDMFGCPNRCLHCWLGHGPNSHMTAGDLRFLAGAFRSFTAQLEVFSWYREPDFCDDYREIWTLEGELSDSKTPHYELMSVWRAARDPDYVPWLAELGVRQVQLTFFGGEAMTDKYTGRRGAWQDLLRSIDLLLANGIMPRIQVFINQETVHDLASVEQIALDLGCPAFVHAGSCDGANRRLYDIRVTSAELPLIPPLLAQKSLEHWKAGRLEDIFGQTEAHWRSALAASKNTASLVSQTPVFFVDANWDVYPNSTTPSPAWRLGNLKADGAETVLARYVREESPAQQILRTVPLGKMVRACGNPKGQGLFDQGDFAAYVLQMNL